MKKRTRGPQPKDPRLAPYPGLGRIRGVYYVRHPLTGNKASLKTKDFDDAVIAYAAAHAQWKDTIEDQLADRIVEKLLSLGENTISIKRKEAAGTTLAKYAAYVREEWLGVRYDEKQKVIKPVQPKMVANTKVEKRQGQPLAVRTARDYGSMSFFQIEPNPDFNFAISAGDALQSIRAALSPWLQKRTHYNHMRNYISRVYQQAIAEGLVLTNPCDHIKQLQTKSRKVYLPDEAYIAITTEMLTDRIYVPRQRKYEDVDTEWQARAVDHLYLISGRPGDVLQFEDSQYNIGTESGLPVASQSGILRFEATKTGQLQEIELNQAIIENVIWFREWKQAQGIVSRYLICYPLYYAKTGRWRNLVGQPLTVNYLSKRFRECAEKAGVKKGLYRLYDNRSRSLTDEAKNQGKHTGKGGHKNPASEEIYIVDEVPVRSKATLGRIERR